MTNLDWTGKLQCICGLWRRKCPLDFNNISRLILNILLHKFSLVLPIWLTALTLCAIKDMLSEALLSFGASSVSMDQDDVSQSTDEVNLLIFVIVNFLFYFSFLLIFVACFSGIKFVCFICFISNLIVVMFMIVLEISHYV